MKKLLVLFIFSVLTGLPAAEVLKVYMAPKVSDTFNPSNMADSSLWKGIPASGEFVYFEYDPQPPDKTDFQRTTFQAAYNRSWLFFKVNCLENSMKELSFGNRTPPRDSAQVTRGAHLEFFLDPDFTRKTAAQIILNTNGGIYDNLFGNNSWNLPLQFKVERRKDAWIVYAAFPWIDRGMTNEFGMIPSGNMLIGFNLCRHRGIGIELTQWSRTLKNAFMRPMEFGVIALASEKGVADKMKTTLTGDLVAGGIDLQGAVSGLGDFYISVIRQNLKEGLWLVTLLPEKDRPKYSAEYAGIQASLKKSSLTEKESKDVLAKISALNAALKKKVFSSIDKNLLNEI